MLMAIKENQPMRLHSILSVATLALAALLLIEPTFAQAVSPAGGAAFQSGNTALQTLQGTITGNIGFLIGLAIAFFGVWTWIVQQNTGAGILMIIGGVLITMVPQIFTGAQSLVSGVVGQFSGGQTQVRPGFSIAR
jgi:type IV secretory pathway VirB2 component (pilin)